MLVFRGHVESGVQLVEVTAGELSGELEPVDGGEQHEDGRWADWGRGKTCGAVRLARAVLTTCLKSADWAGWFVEDYAEEVIGRLPRPGWSVTEGEVASWIVATAIADLNRITRRWKGGR